MSAQPHKYNTLSRLFHWLIVALVALQFLLAELAESAKAADALVKQLALLGHHKSVGMTILVLAVARLGWRLLTPRPSLPETMASWQQWAAQVTHYTFYFLLFALPLTGWLGSSASAYSVSWFGLFGWPDLIEPSPSLKEQLYAAHEILWNAMQLLIVVHVAAAVKHQIFDRDDVLASMFSPVIVVVCAVVFIAAVAAFDALPFGDKNVPLINGSTQDNAALIGSTIDGATQHQAVGRQYKLAKHSDLPVWQIDVNNSVLSFSAEQAGASFEGVFSRWEAIIQFDSANLDSSVIDVSIALDSVDTQDAERDSTLLGQDFFAVARFPEARFVAMSFSAIEADTGPAYRANASLTIKGVTVPVQFQFELEERGDQKVLRGVSRLDRLTLGIGTGDWLDTSWVGQYVDVSTEVIASMASGEYSSDE